MIDVFVDASLSRTKWGCAGVVIKPAALLTFPTLEYRFPIKPGTPSSHGEMLAIVHAACLCEQALKLVDYNPIHTSVVLHTDSQACVTAFNRTEKLRSESMIFLTKKAKREWSNLRDRGIINGWSYRYVARDVNPADAVAQSGRNYFLEIYKWESPSSKKTSGPS